jgi:hypothetical protein
MSASSVTNEACKHEWDTEIQFDPASFFAREAPEV